MTVSRKAVERALGFPSAADERTRECIEECLAELEKEVSPRSTTREEAIEPKEDRVLVGDVTFLSRDLARRLRGCEKAVFMAATLGARADILLRRRACVDMSAAATMQACASVMIEAVCDGLQEKIARDAGREGFFIRPRYSPGYGDWPLTDQKRLIAFLEADKRIGLTVTDACLLTPVKSVTAVIGLSRRRERG